MKQFAYFRTKQYKFNFLCCVIVFPQQSENHKDYAVFVRQEHYQTSENDHRGMETMRNNSMPQNSSKIQNNKKILL